VPKVLTHGLSCNRVDNIRTPGIKCKNTEVCQNKSNSIQTLSGGKMKPLKSLDEDFLLYKRTLSALW